MGTLHREIWTSNGAGSSRRQRASGVYYWFLPTRLLDMSVALDADVVSDVARAERALVKVDANELSNTEGIARLLLRSEAVASSRIEGLVIGSNRLLRAELQAREPGALRYDSKAAAVLGNIHAMEQAVHLASDAREITIETLKEVHRALCANTSLEEWGGIIRPMQNWVGGGGSNPLNAEFVPPAPQEVEALLDDLCEYANRTDVSPVVQAALCHAQFETIHPFVDGNGRVGRALIQSVLLRRRAVGNVVPPISLALATQRKDYYASLNAYQHALDANLESRAVNDWVSCFCGAVCDASVDIEEISNDLQHIKDDWRNKLPRVRADSTLELMLAKMQAMPYFTTETMVAATKRSKQAVGQAVNKLLEAQIICQTSRGKRSRVFEVPDILEEFNVVERRLASPSRDTSVDLPVRPVPNKHI